LLSYTLILDAERHLVLHLSKWLAASGTFCLKMAIRDRLTYVEKWREFQYEIEKNGAKILELVAHHIGVEVGHCRLSGEWLRGGFNLCTDARLCEGKLAEFRDTQFSISSTKLWTMK
jgi:hypothetical protein